MKIKCWKKKVIQSSKKRLKTFNLLETCKIQTFRLVKIYYISFWHEEHQHFACEKSPSVTSERTEWLSHGNLPKIWIYVIIKVKQCRSLSVLKNKGLCQWQVTQNVNLHRYRDDLWKMSHSSLVTMFSFFIFCLPASHRFVNLDARLPAKAPKQRYPLF